MLIDQGYDTMEGASGDDWISGAQSMRGYLRGAEIAGIMGDVLRAEGFPARAQTNADSDVLHIPLLMWAGLGELSRIGELVLNPFVGPRFKSVVLTTDMPLEPDQPIDFGLQYFCSNCLKCARECPCDAIPFDDKVVFNGYEMWKPDVERCTRYRLTNPHGSACGRCMKTCPLNKVVDADGPLLTRAASWLGVNAMFLKPLMVPIATWLDDALGNGFRNPVKKWWFDHEIVDGVAVTPRGTNTRDIDPARKVDAEKIRMAYYHADMMPPPDQADAKPVDRKAAMAAKALLETPEGARASPLAGQNRRTTPRRRRPARQRRAKAPRAIPTRRNSRRQSPRRTAHAGGQDDRRHRRQFRHRRSDRPGRQGPGRGARRRRPQRSRDRGRPLRAHRSFRSGRNRRMCCRNRRQYRWSMQYRRPATDRRPGAVVTVNFIALRRFTLAMIANLNDGAAIVNLASLAGFGWPAATASVAAAIAHDWDGDTARRHNLRTFEVVEEFCDEHQIDDVRSYFFSKEALIVWTMQNRWTWRERGIRMNSISPGPVDTPILPDFLATLGERAEEDMRIMDRPRRAGRHRAAGGLPVERWQRLAARHQHRVRRRYGLAHRTRNARAGVAPRARTCEAGFERYRRSHGSGNCPR